MFYENKEIAIQMLRKIQCIVKFFKINLFYKILTLTSKSVSSVVLFNGKYLIF